MLFQLKYLILMKKTTVKKPSNKTNHKAI